MKIVSSFKTLVSNRRTRGWSQCQSVIKLKLRQQSYRLNMSFCSKIWEIKADSAGRKSWETLKWQILVWRNMTCMWSNYHISHGHEFLDLKSLELNSKGILNGHNEVWRGENCSQCKIQVFKSWNETSIETTRRDPMISNHCLVWKVFILEANLGLIAKFKREH